MNSKPFFRDTDHDLLPKEGNTHAHASSPKRHLAAYLSEIWQQHFVDIPRANIVEIVYGKRWKCRLGCIRLSQESTVSRITINGLLCHKEVPLCVLVVTIAHEVAHYAHGFGSPLPRLHEHPHANHVVTHELERRGLGNALQQCLTWIDQEWFAFYAAQRDAGWPECSPKRDWSMPPTSQEALAISHSLQTCTRQRAREE